MDFKTYDIPVKEFESQNLRIQSKYDLSEKQLHTIWEEVSLWKHSLGDIKYKLHRPNWELKYYGCKKIGCTPYHVLVIS